MSGFSRDDELYACLALVKAKGMGPRTWKKILEHYQSPAQALEDCRSWKNKGLVRVDQLEGFLSWSWAKEADDELELITRKNLKVILWNDPDYPERLKEISGPPAMMYCRGDVSLLKNSSLAAVGSRQSSRYGQEMAIAICSDLAAAGMTIVSGFAYGIDRQAHLAAVESAGGTIAVLGTGIDLIYPAMNKDLWGKIVEHGLILTEFSPGTKPDPGNFPYRNRIISGIALGVLVVQSAIKSGSMITAQLALDQNREVFAVPGAVNMDNYDGCNHLIKQGAHLVQNAEDILEIIAPMLISPSGRVKDRKEEIRTGPRPSLPPDLDPDEQAVAQILCLKEQVHIDDLIFTLNWPSQKVSQTMVIMEIKGLVKRMPGMYYSLTRQPESQRSMVKKQAE